jgi:putative two-component system response regulator
MKFLIVDDDAIINKLLTSAVSKYFPQAQIKCASNGLDALVAVTGEKFVPDIILMDFMMPRLNGYDTSVQIKEWAKTKDIFIYIIMITAKTEKDNEIQSLNVVDDFIHKPLDIDLLVSRIKAGFRIINLLGEKNSLIHKNSQMYEHLVEINNMNESLLTRMAEVIEQMATSLSEAIEYKDMTTGSHVLRVGYVSERLARQMDMDEDQVNSAKYSGFFHDIGKIGVADHILQKEGKLTDSEYEEIKKHSLIGAEIIKPINYFKSLVDGIKHHHERWDGKGYPSGLQGENIPIIARIIAVADVFDVIISPRPYKAARTMEEAFVELKSNQAQQFDGKIVANFEKLFFSGQIHEIYNDIASKKQTSINIAGYVL